MNTSQSYTYRISSFVVLLVAACMFFLGCRNDQPVPVTPTNPFVFSLTGTKDFHIENNGVDSMIVSITRVRGSSEKISLYMEGLPSGVTATIKPESALPPFTSTVIIKGNNAEIGIFNAELKAVGATAGTHSFPIVITTFKEDIECLPNLVGTYSVSEDCEGSQVWPYQATIALDPDNKKGIIIHKFANLISVKAEVVCGSRTLVVPEQKVGPHTVSGVGTFTDEKLEIDYSLTSNLTTEFTSACKATYRK